MRYFFLASFWVVRLLAPRGFRVCPWKKIVVRFDVFVIILALEDRIINIKRGEISELFGVFLYFPHQKWRPCQDL